MKSEKLRLKKGKEDKKDRMRVCKRSFFWRKKEEFCEKSENTRACELTNTLRKYYNI